MDRWATAQWRKSTESGQNDCVLVAFDGKMVGVRHSKHPDGAVLVFSRREWQAFVKGAQKGEFDF